MNDIIANLIAAVSALLIFVLGLSYDKFKQRKQLIKQFAAELLVNKMNLEKLIIINQIQLNGKSPEEIDSNESVVNDERKVYLMPMLDESVMEVIKNSINIGVKRSIVLEYYSLTKRFNWLIDRVKTFKIRLNALEELIKISKEIEQSIEDIQKQSLIKKHIDK